MYKASSTSGAPHAQRVEGSGRTSPALRRRCPVRRTRIYLRWPHRSPFAVKTTVVYGRVSQSMTRNFRSQLQFARAVAHHHCTSDLLGPRSMPLASMLLAGLPVSARFGSPTIAHPFPRLGTLPRPQHPAPLSAALSPFMCKFDVSPPRPCAFSSPSALAHSPAVPLLVAAPGPTASPASSPIGAASFPSVMPPPSRPPLSPTPPPSTFLIHGWRWHHLSLARDFAHLARVAAHPPPYTPPVCSTGGRATATAIVDALTFLAAHNLGVHNTVEERLLFPFLAARLPDGHPVRRALPSFSDRRAALAARVAAISAAVAGVTPADTPACRAAWGGGVAPGLARLAADAAALYADEEAAVIPAVSAAVDAGSQAAFNRRVIRLVGGGRGWQAWPSRPWSFMRSCLERPGPGREVGREGGDGLGRDLPGGAAGLASDSHARGRGRWPSPWANTAGGGSRGCPAKGGWQQPPGVVLAATVVVVVVMGLAPARPPCSAALASAAAAAVPPSWRQLPWLSHPPTGPRGRVRCPRWCGRSSRAGAADCMCLRRGRWCGDAPDGGGAGGVVGDPVV